MFNASVSRRRPAAALLAAALALSLAGCNAGLTSGGGGMLGNGGLFGSRTTTQAAAGEQGEIDIRRYLGPDYCPQVRVRGGAEALRRYVRGHEDDAGYVVWQAAVGQTARECLYDLQGNLTIRVGVSGRVLAGPKGGPGDVTLPLRIAVLQGTNTVLASELHRISATIPASNTTSFAEVREITVRAPGDARNYLIYVGFDDGSG